MSGTIQPSGRFTLGFVPRKKISAKDAAYQKNSDTWDCVLTVLHKPGRRVIKRYNYVQNRVPLRLVDAHYLRKTPRAPRGTHGLTRHGKRFVRESCHILESKYSVQKLGFYTFTLPAVRDCEAWDAALLWNKIVKYFFKLLRIQYVKKTSVPLLLVGVHEIQPKRSERAGIPFYHIHFVMPCYFPGTSRWLFSADDLRGLWRQSLSAILPSFSALDYGATVDACVLRKSASGYLSKYFTKGSSLDGVPSECLLTSWYFCTNNMRKVYKTACIPLNAVNCSEIVENLSNPSICLYWDFVTTPSATDGRDIIRGYYGALTPEYITYKNFK